MLNMKTLIFLPAVLFILLANYSLSQFGEIRGVVTDKVSGIVLPGATVSCKVNEIILGTITNEKGEYVLKPLTPGDFNIQISFVTYKKQSYNAISVSAEKATYVDVALVRDNNLSEAIITWKPPLIDKGSATAMTTYRATEIAQSVDRDVISIAAQTPGIFQKNEEGSLNVRGSRESNTIFMVDGIKMTGSFSMSTSAIAEISVLTGGIPAPFGDATGGVIIIKTKSHRMR